MPFDGVLIPTDDLRTLCHAAADLIEKRGHAKGLLETPDGRLCLMGALGLAAHGRIHVDIDWPAFHPALNRMGLKNHHEACWWNNAAERTPAEVIARLRAV